MLFLQLEINTIRLSSYLVKKVSYINGVFHIIEEVIRIVNKRKKLIAKTLLYVVLVESDEFLRLTFDLIWTKNVKFAKKTKFGTQFLVRKWPMS